MTGERKRGRERTSQEKWMKNVSTQVSCGKYYHLFSSTHNATTAKQMEFRNDERDKITIVIRVTIFTFVYDQFITCWPSGIVWNKRSKDLKSSRNHHNVTEFISIQCDEDAQSWRMELVFERRSEIVWIVKHCNRMNANGKSKMIIIVQ